MALVGSHVTVWEAPIPGAPVAPGDGKFWTTSLQAGLAGAEVPPQRSLRITCTARIASADAIDDGLDVVTVGIVRERGEV